jgi:hypothetical protein
MQRVIAKLDVLLKGRQQRASVCLSTNLDSPIYIEDSKSQGKSVFVIPPDELYSDQNCFKIINSAQQEILLWAVDGCFVGKGKPLSTAYPKKCDCVFGYENYLGFLELKLDSSEIPSPKAIEGNRQKAVEQLKDMICFLSKALSISGHFKIQGYVKKCA